MKELKKNLRAVKDSLAKFEAQGALDEAQKAEVERGIEKIEKGLRTKDHKMIKEGVSRIARALHP